jgi:uncharacterized protein YraI
MKKGLLIKLLGIMFMALMVISCTPKETATVTANVNFRSGDTIIRVLQKGEIVTLTGEVTEGWTQVKHNGDIGWVSTQYLNKIAPETQSKPTVGQTAQDKPKADTTTTQTGGTTTTTQTKTTTTSSSTAVTSSGRTPQGLDYNVIGGKTVTITSALAWVETGSLDFVLPATIGGLPVTEMERGLSHTTLKTLTFAEPSSLTRIRDTAFMNTFSLKSIVIPNSVTSIGDLAFYCSGITSVTIGNSVTSIGDEAFRHCSNLTSVVIPSNVKSIGWFAFDNCDSLTSVTFAGTIPASGFANPNVFDDKLCDKYLAGGRGTYTRSGNTWIKQ